MAYWHFAAETLRDGSPLPAVGERLPTIEHIEPCVCGYHASARPIDALAYAPGPYVARVRLHGRWLDHGSPIDKRVAQSRECLTPYVDASAALREMARWSALQVIDLWDAPAVVRQYLETGNAWAAARAAARDAAWAAAGDVAWAAARAAARDAARNAQNEHLARLLDVPPTGGLQ